jgi:addiction module HigA family antidote
VKRTAKKLPPIHPGEILREEFMLPRGLSQNALARALNVPPRRINEIVLEKRGITADTALRLALSLSRGNGRGWRSRVRVKGKNIFTSAELWTGLQADYDLRLARLEKARVIERDVEPLAALELAMA